MKQNKIFLTAEWRKLAIVNYAVDASVLKKYLPYQCELDYFNNVCYVSLVGFMFLNTRVKGVKVPFHVNFEEINLRFYVKHRTANDELRRGVVFIKEIVPKPALAFIANTLYKEHYVTMPTNHNWIYGDNMLSVTYQWKSSHWNSIFISASSQCIEFGAGSEEEFITEHYWGYTQLSPTASLEYAVEHPRWHAYPVRDFLITVDFADVYGDEFKFLNTMKPQSVFLMEGSEIIVRKGSSIKNQIL